jgi:hypothetical protein
VYGSVPPIAVMVIVPVVWPHSISGALAVSVMVDVLLATVIVLVDAQPLEISNYYGVISGINTVRSSVVAVYDPGPVHMKV